MNKNRQTALLVLCMVTLLAGCNKMPPIVNTKEDVLRLPTSTEFIRARSLRDEDFTSLSHLPQLIDLDFYGGYKVCSARFSDDGLAVLSSLELPRLDSLHFGYCTNITDASLIQIVKLKTVTQLGIVACPHITDGGLRTLATMPNLTELDLRGCTNITDRGLEYLAAKTNWQTIMFGGCARVTFEAVTNLQHRFPHA
jgi:hypothetical protein